MSKNKVVAVSGGIGSGKSMVCKILVALGYPVYDCDLNAKRIMDEDVRIKELLVQRISPIAVDNKGNINRQAISSIVFNDPDKLHELNSIVHGAVIDDIRSWLDQVTGFSFIETAILYQSGIDRIVNEVWEVSAPDEIRIARVCQRNGISPQEVIHRIKSQVISIENLHPNTKEILNDNHHSLLLQINSLIK